MLSRRGSPSYKKIRRTKLIPLSSLAKVVCSWASLLLRLKKRGDVLGHLPPREPPLSWCSFSRRRKILIGLSWQRLMSERTWAGRSPVTSGSLGNHNYNSNKLRWELLIFSVNLWFNRYIWDVFSRASSNNHPFTCVYLSFLGCSHGQEVG